MQRWIRGGGGVHNRKPSPNPTQRGSEPSARSKSKPCFLLLVLRCGSRCFLFSLSLSNMNMEEGAAAEIICQECKAKPSKYKCPGCSIRSCSLPCVKAHKDRTACTGKRNQTQFVPMSQMDDNLLLSGNASYLYLLYFLTVFMLH